MTTTVWICGKRTTPGNDEWEFQGVFSDEGLAAGACHDSSYFIGPAIINESLPDETIDWDGAYYPNPLNSI